jgi:uncharacterized protein (DUF1501 family)
MLDVLGGRYATCDGASRRSFLRVGALGAFGLALPDLLRARAHGASRKDAAVIQIFLGGGPTHIDTYDLKPNAPKEFRGEFKPIATTVPGLELCELFPQQAKLADKVAVIRSLHHTTSDHNVGSHWVMTGFSSAPQAQRNERPSSGSIVARLRGANRPGIPSYVAIPNAPSFSQAAYLGPGYNPFALNGNPVNDVKVRNLDLPGGLTLDRLDDRRYLLGKLDKINRQRDASGAMEGMDRFTAEAYEMITGPNARKAFDLSQEDPKARDRYGRTQVGQGCLLARRLVEAGVSFVTVSEGNWDHHGQVFQNCRRQLPPLDTAVAALVTDLYERGLADRVLLLVWGEFGRTPRVNGASGRDHWPGSMSALVSGGGLKMGQVVGATNSKAEYPTERALRPEDVLRTVYQVLDIDSRHAFLNDSGRPMPVLNQGEPIRELI